MPCFHPLNAWRTHQGRTQLGKELPDSAPLQLPCGTCLGCRTTRAQHWALRCRLESLDHETSCVATLTYDNDALPPTLIKEHLQLWMKRLRKANKGTIRYFATGEYGERYGRPHYHVILFGLDKESRTIPNAWQQGITYTDHASPQAISYIAGYIQKKIGTRWSTRETINKTTGELWQPPFQLMSRRPGLGSNAKRHYQSWALYAMNNGSKLSVPRYYKGTYQEQATPNEKEETEYEKYKHALTRNTLSQHQLETKERIAYARHELTAALRRYE